MRNLSSWRAKSISVLTAIIAAWSGVQLRAEETPKPVCDCKPMAVKVTRNGKVVNAFQAGPRANTSTDISNFTLASLSITAGDTVTWTNQDFSTHTASADNGTEFDSGFLNFGEQYSHTFNTAGTFPYHCAVHPTMTATITVSAGNQAPLITSALTATAVLGTPFNYTLTATGGPAPTLSFTNVPNGFQVTGATLSGTFNATGQVQIGLHATSMSGTDDKTLTVTVNQVPSITSPITASAFVGEVFNYTMQADGVPAPTLTYQGLPSELQATGATISGTFTATGQKLVTMRAQNSAGTDQKNLTIDIFARPKISSPLTADATLGLPFSYTLTATGTPTPTVSYGVLPNGFQANGPTINGTFNAIGQVQIELHASSTAGVDDKTLVINVAGSASAITSPLTAGAIVGVPFTYTLTATGNPAPALSFTNVPNGFNVNGATISGTFAAAGQVSIGVHAANAAGNDDKTLVVTIDPSTPPAITSVLAANATLGAPFNYTLTATGNPAPTLSFTGLPAGITANGASLSGTFSATGQFSIGLHATNVGGSDDKTLVVTVTVPPVAPSITSLLTASAKVGVLFSYTLTATGAPAPALSFTNVPAALTANGATISGTFSTAGQFSIGLHAINSEGSDDKTLIVTVSPPDVPPVITSTITANATAGTLFTYTLTASGNPLPALSFTGIPAGFSANGGTLMGTFSAAGEFSIGLHASNSAGFDDKTLIVTVVQAPVPAKITSLLTATAIVGLDFSYTITATGDAPITFAATLPSGLTLSGATISGLFATPGTVMIPLTASNSAGSDPQTLVVTVLANTEGISGSWSGKLKGKSFDETGTAKSSVSESGTIEVTFFQTGRDLAARVTLNRPAGPKSYVVNGRVGLNNLWTSGVDSGLQDNVTLSAQMNKNGKSIKGIGIVVNKQGAKEFLYTLSRK